MDNNGRSSWGSFFKKIGDALLTQSSGPYAGRSTMFIGFILLFFSIIIILEKKGTGETPWLAYLFGAFGIFDLISGFFEYKKQKVYEAEKEKQESQEQK